jgi:hypothetical protein
MKKHLLPLLVAVVVLSGCTAAYKTGQTPDDVYYSVGKVVKDAELTTKDKPEEGYTSYWNNAEDDYLRMKVRNGNRWNTLDDYGYWNSFNSMSMMGAFNNPCCCNPGFWNNGFGWNNGFAFNTGLGWNNNWNNNFFWNNGWNTGFNNNWGWNNWGYNNLAWNNRPILYVPGGKNYDAYRNTYRPNLGGYNNTSYDRGSNRNNNKFFNSGSSSNGNGLYRSIFGSGSSNGGSSNSGSSDRPARSLGDGSGSSSGGSSGSSGGGSSRSSGGGGGSRGGRG